RRVDALGPRIQQIADGLLDDLTDTLAERGAADLIGAYAYPLPITVIGELLGVPARDRAGFRDWSTTLVGGAAVGPENWVGAPSRSASRPRSRSCCASTGRCRSRRSAGPRRRWRSGTP